MTRELAQIIDKETGDVNTLRDKKLADATTQQQSGSASTDSVVMKTTGGDYVEIARDSFVGAIKSVMDGLIKGNSYTTLGANDPIAAFNSNALGGITPANLASVLDVLDVPITFESDAVKQIIVEKYGGVSGGLTGIKGFKGEITFRQAAAVTRINDPLFHNTGVSGTFNECKYFKNLLFFNDSSWQYVGISSIIFPEGFTTLGPNTLTYMSNRTLYVEFPASFNYIDSWNINVSSPGVTFKFHSSTPPTLGKNAMIDKVGKVYVPASAINNWKAVDYWNSYGEDLIGY